MRVEVLGVERRRRWSEDEKLSILAAVGLNGATVTDVALRHDVTRSQIYGWRRDLKRKGLLTAEAPVRFVALPPAPPSPALSDEGDGAEATVEIVLRSGRRLRVPADLEEGALLRLIRVTEAA